MSTNQHPEKKLFSLNTAFIIQFLMFFVCKKQLNNLSFCNIKEISHANLTWLDPLKKRWTWSFWVRWMPPCETRMVSLRRMNRQSLSRVLSCCRHRMITFASISSTSTRLSSEFFTGFSNGEGSCFWGKIGKNMKLVQVFFHESVSTRGGSFSIASFYMKIWSKQVNTSHTGRV